MRRPGKWMAVALAALALFLAGRLLPLGTSLEAFQAWVKGLAAAGMLDYGAIYVGVTLALGPAFLLTLGAGFLYGLARGVALVWVSATTGAALAFLIGRSFGRRHVEKLARENQTFGAIDRAVGEKGWRIVLLLRLNPLLPFVVSNYLYGLTVVTFWPYVLASAAGMLPLTVLYTYLGAAGGAAVADRHRSPWEWAALALGLITTIVATVAVSRIARRELEKARLSGPRP
ncbi:MAG TPA: VTT domain-containing protein [Thermoanaerobaculia bacterium]|nr:VTT domain-containing protein [Thermoanaerobaculia bacterium]